MENFQARINMENVKNNVFYKYKKHTITGLISESYIKYITIKVKKKCEKEKKEE